MSAYLYLPKVQFEILIYHVLYFENTLQARGMRKDLKHCIKREGAKHEPKCPWLGWCSWPGDTHTMNCAIRVSHLRHRGKPWRKDHQCVYVKNNTSIQISLHCCVRPWIPFTLQLLCELQGCAHLGIRKSHEHALLSVLYLHYTVYQLY